MEAVPDLDDLMDNWFFGSSGGDELKKKEGKGTSKIGKKEVDVPRDKTTARLTQEWLQEAKKVVATSTPMHSSPSRLTAPPRFVSHMEELPRSSELRDRLIERRDPRSRSARRQRIPESVSSEILSKSSSRHGNSSLEVILPLSPSWPSSPNQRQQHSSNPSADVDPLSPATPPALPQKQRLPRISRFFKQPPPPLPPRTEDRALSPPRNLIVSAHRRSISATTCSLDTLPYRRSVSLSASALAEDVERINAFLMRQKVTLERISSGEMLSKAKVVLSGSSSSTSVVSSMVAAICYAWLLENKGDTAAAVVPVINMSREKMWKHRQAGWLFHHLGIDASSLIFADEVDLEGLIMSRQLNMVVIGQDVLITKDEVGSYCTVLTDHYCEDAYNLLQCPNLKKLLLAGVLLDTQNLNSGAKFFTNRDAEAVQLLLVGSPPNYRQEFFEQLMRHHRSSPFLLAMKVNYGEPPSEASNKLSPSPPPAPTPAPEPKPLPAPPPPVKAPETAPRAKNKFSLAKFFGFGSK